MDDADDFRPYIRALIYGVQFERDPIQGLDRVLDAVARGGILDASPAVCRSAVRAALASDEPLAELIPQDHPEEAIRRFLAELERRLAAGSA